MVAYRDLMGIAAQIFHYLWRPKEWTFAIDHPIVPEQAFIKRGRLAVSLILAQPGHEARPKDLAHCLYGEQVLSLAIGGSPFAALGDPASRDNAVQVWVQREVLAPGVQDGDHSHLGAQKFGIGAKVADSAPGRFEQKAVHHLWLVQAQPVQLTGQGKDHMEVGDLQ